MQKPATPQLVAEEPATSNSTFSKKPVGKQDQYMAAFGGLTSLEIDQQGCVRVNRVSLDAELVKELENKIVLFYTHEKREAMAILSKQDSATRN